MAAAPINPKEQESIRDNQSPLDAFKSGKIDIFSLVFLVPESNIPPSLLAQYKAVRESIQAAASYGSASADKKGDKQSLDKMRNALELLRVTHGSGYVEAYIQLKRTDTALQAGLGLFEDKWFHDLQASRRQQIEQLEELRKAGTLTKDQATQLRDISQLHDTDHDAHQKLRALADRSARLSERALAGELTEKELAEHHASIKRDMIAQIDRMSPEVREAFLERMKEHDPDFVKEYETRADNRAPTAPNFTTETAHNPLESAEESIDSTGEDDMIMEAIEGNSPPDVSSATKYGFPSLTASVNLSESFQTAACSVRDSVTQNLEQSEKPTPSKSFGAIPS